MVIRLTAVLDGKTLEIENFAFAQRKLQELYNGFDWNDDQYFHSCNDPDQLEQAVKTLSEKAKFYNVYFFMEDPTNRYSELYFRGQKLTEYHGHQTKIVYEILRLYYLMSDANLDSIQYFAEEIMKANKLLDENLEKAERPEDETKGIVIDSAEKLAVFNNIAKEHAAIRLKHRDQIKTTESDIELNENRILQYIPYLSYHGVVFDFPTCSVSTSLDKNGIRKVKIKSKK